MNILYLITGLGGGGAEKVLTDLADQMVLKGHQVKIAYLKGEVVVRPRTASIELIYLGLERPIHVFAAYRKYRELILSFKPDVVHTHMIHANIFTRISRLFCPIPKLISSAHSNNEGGWLRMIAYRLTHHLADQTTNVSKNASLNFEVKKAVPLGGILTVYNGIDLDKFNKKHIDSPIRSQLDILEKTPVFIAVGRFHESKDYPNLLKAFSILKSSKHFNLMKPKLLIVGDGELRTEIEQIIKSLDLSSQVFLLGRRDDIPQLLNAANYFVLSSKYEGLPTVIIEAMACHKFVIATDCGGSAELLNETGMLIPVEDSSALALAMEKVLGFDDNFIKNNGLEARGRVEKLFSLESITEEWLKIYVAQ
mgnify:CR=1 FL=1